MRRYVISAITVFVLAIGSVHAQSTATFGVSLSYSVFPLPLPLLGVHAGFDDLLAEDVALRLNLSGIAFGVAGAFVVGGIAAADVVWALPTSGDAALRPYAGGGVGLVFVGGGAGPDLGIELAPQAGVFAGVSFPIDDLSVFLEGRGNVAFGFFDASPWWLSIALGLDFGP